MPKIILDLLHPDGYASDVLRINRNENVRLRWLGPTSTFFSTGEVASEGQRILLEGTVMDDPAKERQIWLDYLGKVNDRALQRQRASGFTNWAIAGVVLALAYQGLNGIPALTTNPSSTPVHVVALATILNLPLLGFALYKLIKVFAASFTETRFQSTLDRSSDVPLAVLVFFCGVLIGSLDLFSAKFAARFGLYSVPFGFTGVAILILCFIYTCKLIILKLRMRKPEGLRLSPFNVGPRHLKLISLVLSLSIVCLFLSFIPVVQALPKITRSGCKTSDGR